MENQSWSFDHLPDSYSPIPRHGFASESEQYRLKVRQFSNCPPEFTVQKINFDRDLDAYARADRAGFSNVHRRRGARTVQAAVCDAESIERSQRRAKTNLRLKVTELAPNHLSTFTTRETGPEYLTPEDWRVMWASFVRLVRMAGIEFEFVAVLERHPSNPQHLHLHVAWRGRAHYNQLRRFWHIAICSHRGEKINKMLRGVDAPGGIQDKPIKAPRGSFKQVRKIARYISKYITKDLIAEFNKKRYWPSKGIDLKAAQVFWLSGLTQFEAIREACLMMGLWDVELATTPQHLFRPSDRVCWCALDPELIPPPPF